MQSIFTRLQTPRRMCNLYVIGTCLNWFVAVHASHVSSVVFLNPEDVGLIWAKFEVFAGMRPISKKCLHSFKWTHLALFCAFVVEGDKN
jgi:hypothetical protein